MVRNAIYGYANGQRVAKIKPDGTIIFYINDPLGSPLILMDEDGNIVKRYRFDPFGNLEAQWGTEPNRYLFTGKEKDENGLYYFGARYYNPRLGRFVTPDPEPRVPGKRLLENPQLTTPYAYCINNPLRYIDPDGKIVIIAEALKQNPEFMEAITSIPLYHELHSMQTYEVEIWQALDNGEAGFGVLRGGILFWFPSFLKRFTPPKGIIKIPEKWLMYPETEIEAMLFHELTHAKLRYELKGEFLKGRHAEEVEVYLRMFRYIQKKGLKIRPEAMKFWVEKAIEELFQASKVGEITPEEFREYYEKIEQYAP